MVWIGGMSWSSFFFQGVIALVINQIALSVYACWLNIQYDRSKNNRVALKKCWSSTQNTLYKIYKYPEWVNFCTLLVCIKNRILGILHVSIILSEKCSRSQIKRFHGSNCSATNFDKTTCSQLVRFAHFSAIRSLQQEFESGLKNLQNRSNLFPLQKKRCCCSEWQQIF